LEAALHYQTPARLARRQTGVIPFLLEEPTMLQLAIACLVIALILAVLGFGGIAGSFASVAQILFVVFLVLAVLSFFGGTMRRGRIGR
jgi:uncharacterized membrane protein YtjA (UPF0391 family)